MSRNTILFLVLSAAIILIAVPAFAATQNAVVYGTVYDSKGAPIPGITVTLENPSLGFERTTVTGSDGSYNFAEVPPAEGYRLTAMKGGNKMDVRTGITVNVGDERVILPPLKEQPPAMAQPAKAGQPAPKAQVKEVSVASNAVSNETVSTAISGVITGEQLRTLPLYNRNFLILGTLTPNTHDVPGSSNLAGGSFSVAGTRPESNNFLLDGSDNVASSSNQAIPFQVNDAIQEFRLTSSTANAEYGRNAGGTVSVVTRRGGNGFHGSAYGYFADDALNGDSPISVYRGSGFDKAAAYAGRPVANPTLFTPFPLTYNDYVNTAANNGFCTDSIGVAGTTVPCATGGTGANTFFDPAAVLAGNDSRNIPFSSKQFGLNGGGSIIKNKLFWFGSYEGTLIDNPTPIFERVPSTFDRTYDTLNVRAGYAPTPSFGPGNADYDMATSIMSLFPTANVIGVPDALEFYRGTAPAYTDVHNFLGRLDWTAAKKTNLNFRYVGQILDQLHDDTLPASSTYPGNGALRTALNQNGSIGWSQGFGNNVINELRLGVTRFSFQELAQDRSFNATTLGGTVKYPTPDMPTILLNGLDTQYSGSNPGVNGAYCGWADGACNIRPTLDYLFPLARLGAPLNTPSHRRDTTWSIADNLSWSMGKHSFKFGGEYRRINNAVADFALARGFVYSSDIGEFTSDSVTCNVGCSAQEAFHFPTFDFSQKQFQGYDGHFSSDNFSFYVQDTWRVAPRVTLNLGLRYEYFGIPSLDKNQLWNYDPVANGLVQDGSNVVTDQYDFHCGDNLVYLTYPNNFNTDFPSPNTPWTTCNPTGSSKYSSGDNNNWAPRFGLAWDVTGTGKGVLRFGVGWFYDQTPITYISQLMYNRPTGPTVQNAVYGQVLDTNGGFCLSINDFCGSGNRFLNPPQAYGGAFNNFVLADQPNAIYARNAQHTDTPYTRQISATWQEQWTGKLATEVGYISTYGWELPQIFDARFQQEWTLFGPGAFNTDNTGFTPILTNINQGNSSYNSLMARARVANFHGLRLNATYTYSQAYDNAWNGRWPNIPVTGNNLAVGYQFRGNDNPVVICIYVGIGCGAITPTFPNIDFSGGAVTTTGSRPAIVSDYNLPQDPFHYSADEYGRSDYDSRHKFVMDYSWDIPTKAWGAPKWLNDWTLSGIWTMQSGQPFTVFAGPILGQINERANVSGTPKLDYHNPDNIISASNFSLATAKCFSFGGLFFNSPFLPNPGQACTGNSAKGGFAGPNYFNMNFAVQKGFPFFGEGRNLIVRAEFYNVFDRANYYNPISQISLDGFNVNPDFGKVKSAHDPRQIQLAVRFNW